MQNFYNPLILPCFLIGSHAFQNTRKKPFLLYTLETSVYYLTQQSCLLAEGILSPLCDICYTFVLPGKEHRANKYHLNLISKANQHDSDTESHSNLCRQLI